MIRFKTIFLYITRDFDEQALILLHRSQEKREASLLGLVNDCAPSAAPDCFRQIPSRSSPLTGSLSTLMAWRRRAWSSRPFRTYSSPHLSLRPPRRTSFVSIWTHSAGGASTRTTRGGLLAISGGWIFWPPSTSRARSTPTARALS